MDEQSRKRRWQRIKELYSIARELEGKDRDAYLRNACGDDSNMLAELLGLLDAGMRSGPIDRSADNLKLSALGGMQAISMAGRLIGPYKILGILGSGGMGNVYLAERADGQFNRNVALKLLSNDFTSENQLQRFMAERQILATLKHENIARMLDGGLTPDGYPYIVMEYIDGQPLDVYCDSRRLSIRDRLNLFTSVCDAVQYAHGKLIIHRDLKPSNIMVTGEGVVKLLDFGIAKVLEPDLLPYEQTPVTRTGLLPLTPAYASPEQIRGEPVTTASDVYQLGIVLCELLTGSRPYVLTGTRPSEIEAIICDTEPGKPSTLFLRETDRKRGGSGTPDPSEISGKRKSTPAQLARRLRGEPDTIILKALRKEPDRRYRSSGQLAADIRRYLDGRPVSAHPDSKIYRARKFIRRHRNGVTFTAILVLVLAGYAASITWHSAQTRAALEHAQRQTAKAEQITEILIDMFKGSDPGEMAGDTVTAGILLERGIEQVEQLDDQPDVQAQLYNVVGSVYHSLGKFEQAEILHNKALEIRRQFHGENHTDIAHSHYNLGSVMHDMGRYHDSDAHFAKAVEIYSSDPKHTSTEYANSLHNLANIQSVRRNQTEAGVMHRKALDMRRKLLGNNHPDVARSLHGTAYAMIMQNDLVNSRIHLEEAIRIFQLPDHADHPFRADILIALADIDQRTGHPEMAETRLQEALDHRIRIYGTAHMEPLLARKHLADFYRHEQQFDKAKSLYRAILDDIHTGPDDQHPLLRPVYQAIGRIHIQEDEPELAEPYFRKTLDMITSVLNPVHPRTAAASLELGICLNRLGKFDEAEKRFLSSLQIYRELKSGDDNEGFHSGYITTLEHLVQMYENQGIDEQAALYEGLLAEISAN